MDKLFERVTGTLRYRTGTASRTVALGPEGKPDNEDLALDLSLEHSAQRLSLRIGVAPRRALELESAFLELRLPRAVAEKVVSALANGYQSWSLTRELGRSDRLKPVSGLLAFLKPLGDTRFVRYRDEPGRFHSWSFTHLRLPDGFVFVGSTSEDSGFTVLHVDLHEGLLRVEKECGGRRIDVPFALFGLHAEAGRDLGGLVEGYRRALGIEAPKARKEKATGWTSWYRYFTNIDEQAIANSLDAVARFGAALDYFQIDDGYAPAVGDWLLPSGRFPGGMARQAEEIRTRGLVPGLWLAPFIAERRSKLVEEHPEWLLRDEKGKRVAAGWNPLWSGTFYALDLARPDVRDHLARVLGTMTEQWGYELIKADFLYAAALRGGPEATRGERMAQAIRFLRECLKGRELLACGPPLMSVAGEAEYCRVGPDVSPYWEDRKLRFFDYRERVSTCASLHNTLNRHHLDRQLFLNDPDVFILRRTETKLTAREARTLFLVNYLLSGILLFSDDPMAWGPAEAALFRRALPAVSPEHREVTPLPGDCYRIDVRVRGQRFLALVNLGDAEREVALGGLDPETRLFDQFEETLELARTAARRLPPHGCTLFKLSAPGILPQVLGGTGHLLCGAGPAPTMEQRDDGSVSVTLDPTMLSGGRLLLELPGLSKDRPITVNGVPAQMTADVAGQSGLLVVEARC